MLHTHVRAARRFPTREKNRTDWGLVAIGLVLIALSVWAMRVASAPALAIIPNSVLPGTGGSATAADRTNALADFEQRTHALVVADSDKAFQTLLLSLKENEPLAQRGVVLAALQDASPEVLPVLIAALTDADPGIRAGAAQELGMRNEDQAIAALTVATYDTQAAVRLQAVRSLGALGAWQALPRLEQLSVSEGFDDARQAASTARENLRGMFAAEIGVSASQLRDIAVTSTDPPQVYAVTATDLYARHPTLWELVSRLPDAPFALATGMDPHLIYLATVSSGLYRSLDSGQTWEHVEFGLRTPTPLTVTAVVVDPQNSRRVYVALATQSAKPGAQDALGIFASQDGGGTWVLLPDSPSSVITTRLVMDSQSQGYLYGMIDDTPWRYTLPSDVADSQQDGRIAE